MSRFFLGLALVAALFSYSAAEVVVGDNLGDAKLNLPTDGGNPDSSAIFKHNAFNVSPFCIWVSINDGDPASPNTPDYSGETEFFYFSAGGFGDGVLINQSYSRSWNTATPSDSVLGSGQQFLGTATNQIAAEGTYTYCFTIPPQGTLSFMITYTNNATDQTNVRDTVFQIPVSINNANPSVVGDPQFVGLRGQSYQVHGIDGAVYNIITEPSTQVNSRFSFLTEGQCPMINGKPDSNCWSHPGSYLGEMSFQAIVNDKVHAALIEAGSAQKGFAGVQVDGKALSVGDLVTFGAFSVEYISTHLVAVTTDNYSFQLSNSDMFINQALRATTPLSKLTSHGLLGQTHSIKTYATALKYIEGEVDDYVIQDGNIFGTDFQYNQFSL